MKNSKPEKLDAVGRAAFFNILDGWQDVDGRDAAFKSYKFDDFEQAFAFMIAVAMKAEELNHHPEWFNVYNRVDVTLTTHDADGLSALDRKMAEFMDSLLV